VTLYQTAGISFFASAFAEAFALPFYYPFDIIKTRMQTSNESKFSGARYKNIADAACKIWREPGRKGLNRIRGFYNGMGMYSLTYITFMGFEFGLYEFIARLIQNTYPSASDSSSIALIAGLLAGSVAGMFTNPLETLQVNKQVDAKFKI
jgi:hypothetical protein